MALINCPECNQEISDKSKTCPNCGYPLEDNNTNVINQTQSGEGIHIKFKEPEVIKEPNSNIKVNNKPKYKIKNITIIAVAIIGVIIIGSLIGIKIKRDNYIENLYLITDKMLDGASKAESLCNLTAEVWGDTIFKNRNSKTEKYVYSNYNAGLSSSINGDFNDSLRALYEDDSTKNIVSFLKSNQTEIDLLLNELKNPPKEFKDIHNILGNVYVTYKELTNLAINPSGNYYSFIEDKSLSVKNFINNYDKFTVQIPN